MRYIKTLTIVGLLGLAVLHPDAISNLANFAVDAFRGVTTIAPGVSATTASKPGVH